MISEMFAHGFIQRAFIGGVLVSLCAALLGVSLVLKRYSMIGDGLSHVSFGALSIAIAFGLAQMCVVICLVVFWQCLKMMLFLVLYCLLLYL